MIDDRYIKDIIADYTDDEMVRSTTKNINKTSFMQKIINKFVDKKKNNLLYLVLKIHVMARGV